MTSADHSSLVYLLGAIEVAPSKSRDLLALAARRQGASEGFKEKIRQLQDVAERDGERALLESSKDLSEYLREV